LEEFDHIKSLAKKFGKKIEFLMFQWDVKVSEKYYWAGEAEIFDYFFEHSQLLKESKSFYKISGRYIIDNINRIIEVSADLPNYFTMQFWNFEISTYLLKISKEIYEKYLLYKIAYIYSMNTYLTWSTVVSMFKAWIIQIT
jgi:hypothetical protein